MTDLRLAVPTLLAHDNPLAECNPRKVAAMVSELPLMNPVASVTQLLNALQPLNQQAMPARDRLRLLELYRAPVSGIFNTFDHRGLRLVAASPAQRKQLVTDISRLCQELALGYKLLVVQGAASGRDPAQDQELLIAIARALEQLGHALVHCYRIYAPVPAGLYLELHQLYRYAEAHQVVSRDVPGGRAIAGAYRRLMLTACADPAHLGEGDVFDLYEVLGDYSEHCHIQPGRGMDPPNGCFVIDLEADTAPIPCAKVSARALLGDPRVMDARDIGKVLHQRLHATTAPAQDARNEAEQRVLTPLLRQLEYTPQRRGGREAVQQPLTVAVAVGIPAIHYFLSPEGEQQIQREAESRHIGIEVFETEESEAREYYRLQDWRVLDRSEQGYRLQYQGSSSHQMRVGELLGIDNPQAEGPRRTQLGVVRWLRQPPDGQREIGVELITGVASPVICHPLGEDARHIDQRVGLFLPSQAEPRMSATLLTPKKIYSRGRQLRVDVGQKPLTVEAGHLVMDTACFDRFTFKSAQEG